MVGFATYTRDQTGLDYAHNRYYFSTLGRFLSPDPSGRSMDPRNPQSFNRYAYVQNDPVNGNDPRGLYVQDCDWDGGCFDPANPENLWSATNTAGGIRWVGALWAMEEQFEAEYDAMVAAAFARAALITTPDPDCVQDAISAAARGTGLDLGGLTNPWVQIVGTANGAGGDYGETELNLSGSAGAIQNLIGQMCSLGSNNGQCPGESGSTLLVGAPHDGFTGNFRSPGLLDSVQVNTNVETGQVQIDVDPYNPAAIPILGAILHGVLQVLPNKITGSDNTYGCGGHT